MAKSKKTDTELVTEYIQKLDPELGKLIASPGEGTDAAQALGAFADVYMTWGVYVTLTAAVVLFFLSPILKKGMHGIQ